MKLMLARAKDIPVDFTFDPEGELNQNRMLCKTCQSHVLDFLPTMLAQTTRFRSLTIRNKGQPLLEDLLSKASGRAPALTHLDISAASDDDSWRDRYLPRDFLEGGSGAPALQHLRLERIKVPWDDIPLPSTLTHLTLREGGDPREGPFYESLSQLASLQHLDPDKWLPDANPPAGEVEHLLPTSNLPLLRLTFPSLRRLTVEDSAASLTRFFRRVWTPNVVCLKLTIKYSSVDARTFRECLREAQNAIGGSTERFQNSNRMVIRNFGSRVWDCRIEPFSSSTSQTQNPSPIKDTVDLQDHL
ncbi:hypothetical protein FA13DRAFT_1818534 [Coprinellus micaceus]|uniref:F-box domain-containing protein n=1 Tax=Coprinellus micaceus TaxID=71717 RepID=A0A4Y7SNH4_COPMI|nr:hypothetical protein FA13DRAFT_1451887 [Coprinellus micaceus]TEB23242.1 hypothetical protein FA13DRAFT_1818534 [Coprinellus micaceus]